jgi:peptidoglycan/LPS O-acetylase OafA/YrhL
LKLRYVEGLRAVAVMGVVLFHFGAWWLPGGFAGVDVFFVISGFVISRSIFREMEAGRFSLLDFYWRRARRIIPALIVVTLASMLVGVLILYPNQLVELAKSSAAAMAFSSNIYFFWTTDYFGANANEVPLLHYWSLGVEERFYLIYLPSISLA